MRPLVSDDPIHKAPETWNFITINGRCGPLSGYRVDYHYLHKLHCRFAMLAGDGFHMLVNITLPPKQADDLLPAIDAVFESIRAL
jgi:hypothetical protein